MKVPCEGYLFKELESMLLKRSEYECHDFLGHTPIFKESTDDVYGRDISGYEESLPDGILSERYKSVVDSFIHQLRRLK